MRDDQVPTYNSYDNAVLYNDFVVSSLIKDYAKSDPNGFLLYLSDHGEDVFDSVGHKHPGPQRKQTDRADVHHSVHGLGIAEMARKP